MNRLTLRTLLCFAILSVLIAALGIGASAQDVMPLPQVGGQSLDGRTIVTPDQTAPADLAEMRTATTFSWIDVGAPKYKLTFTETETNIKHVLKVKATKCNGSSCNVIPPTSFFAQIKDGMLLTWQVTAMMPDGKLVSGFRSVTVNEVVQPTLSGPVDGGGINFNGQVSWSNANIINSYFRVVFIDPTTGKKALNLFYNSHACDATCSITPRHFTNSLTNGVTYQWYVQAVGYSGESVKSEKRSIVMQ